MHVTRTQDEIWDRAKAADDMFGWAQELLLPYLDYDHAKPILNDDVTAEAWAEHHQTDESLEQAARDYYAFALGKIEAERGISAERSVIKLREFAWLAGRDDVVEAMDAAEYAPYGAPKAAEFGRLMGMAERSA